MSTSPISFGSVPDQLQSQERAGQIRQDFKQLASSLQAGDLAAAQKAYSALQQLLPNPAQSSQQSGSAAKPATNPIASDFQAVGQALQSGDLTSAQNAFSQLKTDLGQSGASGAVSGLVKGLRGHHGHHHVSSAPDNDSSSSSSPNSSSSSSPLDTIGAAGSSNSGGSSLNLLA